MRRKYLKFCLAGAVSLITFAVYLPALRNGFVDWDDGVYVFDNTHIRSFDAALLKWAFLGFYALNWHPLTWLSHALDYAFWGLTPLGHHLTNTILHALNTFVVMCLLIRLLQVAQQWRVRRGLPSVLDERTILAAAGVTALLFGIHPVHVESVAWVSERKDLLCALFFLLSIAAYASYVGSESRDDAKYSTFSRFANKNYLLALGLFVLALMSKPMAVTLPAVLLILDWYPFGRITSLNAFGTVFAEKIPFVALSITSSAVTVIAQRAGGALAAIKALPLTDRLLVAARSLVAYLGNMLLPLDLIPYYPYPGKVSLLSGEYIAAIALVAGVTVACVALARRHRLWLSVWAYYVVTLIPVLGIVQVGRQAMADRYTYLPSIGPFLVIGLAVAWSLGKRHGIKRRNLALKTTGVAAAIFMVAGSAYLTVNQTGIWRNSFTLWDYVIEQEGGKDPLPFNSRGIAWQRAGQFEKAIEDYDKAITLEPAYYEAFFNRATVHEKMGRIDKAIDDYNTAIALKPSYYEAFLNRGRIFEKKGLFDRAIQDYEKTIALNPSSYEANFALGFLYARNGLFDEALKYFTRSIGINPNNADAYSNRGVVYSLSGNKERALEDYNKAVLLDRGHAVTYFNRAVLNDSMGKRESAVSDLRKACELGSEDACLALRGLLPK